MSEAKHTPAPWKAFADEFVNEDEIEVRAGTAIVCRVWPMGDDEIGVSESAANAHMIAAAPDLLAACEAVEAYYDQAGIGDVSDPESDDDNEGFDGDECFNVRMLRAAIAKAKGQQ